jgi:hypothetical protein
MMADVFEDNDGCILMSEEVEELSPYEIEERGIHYFDEAIYYDY